MDDQRIKEDRLCPLKPQERRRIMPFKHFVKFLREIKVKLGMKPILVMPASLEEEQEHTNQRCARYSQ